MVENSHWAEGLGEYSAVWGADNKKNGAENVQRSHQPKDKGVPFSKK